jgi:hypothetical protein
MSKFVRNLLLATDLQKFLMENDMIKDTRIYFDGVAIENGERLIQNVKASEFFEYGNDETVALSFESTDLYTILNYGGNNEILKKLDEVFERHGAYYELGNAWNLSAYYMNEEEK